MSNLFLIGIVLEYIYQAEKCVILFITFGIQLHFLQKSITSLIDRWVSQILFI